MEKKKKLKRKKFQDLQQNKNGTEKVIQKIKGLQVYIYTFLIYIEC